MQMQTTINNYTKKLEMNNKIMEENEQLKKLVEDLKKEQIEVKRKSEKDLVDLVIKNKLKFSILKKKMVENIKHSQIKVIELNKQYMDVSFKLTLSQNHQHLTQLEYLQEQLNEYSKTNELLQKNNNDLKKYIEINKEVELALAEKNKKLKNEILKEKDEKEDKDEFSSKDDDKEKEEDKKMNKMSRKKI